jgi:hypothetical protein
VAQGQLADGDGGVVGGIKLIVSYIYSHGGDEQMRVCECQKAKEDEGAMGRSIGICPWTVRRWEIGSSRDAQRNVMRQPRVSSCRGSRETRDLI